MKDYQLTSDGLMVVAICLFAFFSTPWVRATGLTLILVALAALTIDYFSKERGITYQQELNSVHIEQTE